MIIIKYRMYNQCTWDNQFINVFSIIKRSEIYFICYFYITKYTFYQIDYIQYKKYTIMIVKYIYI